MPSENLNRSDELLLALLDGPFKRVRDQNHVDPHAILVWDPSRIPVIQAVGILDLLGRYPCGGNGSQWAASDLLEILIEKRSQCRKSNASHDISDDDPEFTPACGTVVLIVSDDPSRGHRWVSINALIEPGQ
ncbi:hypothetical protein [Synechococcus sp. CS-1332]|uniref:hypothetical protein n=1 Tax=Synechococcus sp. CS-1332 TaxID=2847972 RepID=UPI00223A8DC9|nr:hypothetical protein [Synechococcus sp. CS-1332]MCT0206449.1 hypothetical protein [Synechococcus sp. CS-1332]